MSTTPPHCIKHRRNNGIFHRTVADLHRRDATSPQLVTQRLQRAQPSPIITSRFGPSTVQADFVLAGEKGTGA